ncbi:MAG: zinc-dependent metalloprotease, partial [Phycisphaerales bacterium JB038]
CALPICVFWYQANELLPQIAMENFGEETLTWLRDHPEWDPRVRLAAPERRDEVLASIAQGEAHQHEHDAHTCMAEACLAMDMSTMSMHLSVANMMIGEDGDEGEKLDGIPEWFVGPMVKSLVTHEVGHTLGLRHNFKASSIYEYDEINSEELKGNTPFAASVMDYNPVNISMDDDLVQGDYGNTGIGPYDYWAIEYGYTFDNPKEVLKRVAEPQLIYGTDEDSRGPDPLVRTYDLAADPLDYAENQIKLVNWHRERILDEFVKDGESWDRARRGYSITLNTQASAISIMSNWLGGAFVYRDHKGDPDGRAPHEPVPAAQQRAALDFVIKHAFYDEAFGITPELLAHMATEKWGTGADSTWAVHDNIMGVQASALTQIINPTTLRRIYDNEMLVPAEEDMITLPEVLTQVRDAVWEELEDVSDGDYSERQPLISSLRRALQREYLDRMLSLARGNAWSSASGQTLAGLIVLELEELEEQIGDALDHDDIMDRYTLAHLREAEKRIDEILDAGYLRTD